MSGVGGGGGGGELSLGRYPNQESYENTPPPAQPDMLRSLPNNQMQFQQVSASSTFAFFSSNGRSRVC